MIRIKALNPFSGARCLTLEHSVQEGLGKVYRSCWRQPVLNGLQVVPAAGKKITGASLKAKGGIRGGKVGNRVSSSIQKWLLRCTVLGPGERCSSRVVEWGPFAVPEELCMSLLYASKQQEFLTEEKFFSEVGLEGSEGIEPWKKSQNPK